MSEIKLGGDAAMAYVKTLCLQWVFNRPSEEEVRETLEVFRSCTSVLGEDFDFSDSVKKTLTWLSETNLPIEMVIDTKVFEQPAASTSKGDQNE